MSPARVMTSAPNRRARLVLWMLPPLLLARPAFLAWSGERSGLRPRQLYQELRDLIERNIMRSFLALEASLDRQTVPAPHRFEARLNAAYELTERYPLQLHELEKPEYLAAKRRERQDQLRLQQAPGTSGTRPTGGQAAPRWNH